MKKREKNNPIFFVFLLMVLSVGHELLAAYAKLIVKNYGVSFGIEGINLGFIMLLLLGISWFGIKERKIGWYFLMAGGWVNFVDRLRLGYVRDYWKIPVVDLFNNLNDMVIFWGIILIIIEGYARDKSNLRG